MASEVPLPQIVVDLIDEGSRALPVRIYELQEKRRKYVAIATAVDEELEKAKRDAEAIRHWRITA
jgi:hypothetical protein